MESRLLEGHKKGIRTLAWSPDSNLLATSSYDNTIRLWERGGAFIRQLKGHHSVVDMLAWSPDSQLLASVEPGGGSHKEPAVIGLWQKDGDLVKAFKTSPVVSSAWSLDGEFLATGAEDKIVRLWNREGELFKELNGHTGQVYSLAWSPKSGMLVSSSKGGEILFWDEKWNFKQVSHDADRGAITKLKWSPEGELLASYDGGKLFLWNEKAELIKNLTGGIASASAHTEDIMDVQWGPEGELLISVSWDRTIEIWTREGECIKYLRVPDVRSDTHFFLVPRSISWTLNENIIASTFNDGILRFLNTEAEMIGTWKLNLFKLKSQSAFANPLVMALDMVDYDDKLLWSPDGEILAIWERTNNSIIILEWISVDKITSKTSEDAHDEDVELKEEMMEQKSCPICHQTFRNDDVVYRCNYCRTIYHRLCILQWIINESHKMCPQCNNIFITE